MLETYLTSLITVLVFMTAIFLVALSKKRNDIADIVWGPGFILVAVVALARSVTFSPRALLVLLLVTLWGMRLAWHIGRRHMGRPEDSRYAKWRGEWGKWFVIRSFLQIFMLQGVLLTLVALPITVIGASPASPLGLLDAAGVVIWAAGFLFEIIADHQLASFVRNSANRGKIIMNGLWSWSRHPNYFGEVTLWWGVWLISLATPYGWLAILGPMTITTLILKVSGIPMLEAQYQADPEYQAYAQRTSVFIPLPPGKER